MKKYYKIEECCKILDNLRIPVKASERNEGPYPYFGANGLQGTIDKYIFDDELVLVAEDGGHFDSKDKQISYRVSGKCWVNNHAHVLKPLELIDVDFLNYSLMRCNTKGLVNGATRKKLNQSSLKKIKIWVPELNEQKLIVNKLKTITSIIQNKKKQLEKLDLLIKARFVEMFGDYLNSDNNAVLLSKITRKIGSGATPKGGKSSYCNKGISLIRSMNVHNNVFCFKDLAHINEVQANNLSNVVVESGDVLLNITGASVARCCTVPDEVIPARVNQHVSIIRPRNMINPKYLEYYFTCSVVQNKLLNIAEGGATRQAITKAQLNNFTVPLPPLELQNQFADFVKQVEVTKASVQKSLDKTQMLFDSLMQEYFG